MPPALRLALVLAAPLALAACGSGKDKGRDQRTAAGEILPGSLSDAMLPYDTVRSQPPLAPKAASSGQAKGDAAADGGPDDPPVDPAGDATAAPAEAPPSPVPTPE